MFKYYQLFSFFLICGCITINPSFDKLSINEKRIINNKFAQNISSKFKYINDNIIDSFIKNSRYNLVFGNLTCKGFKDFIKTIDTNNKQIIYIDNTDKYRYSEYEVLSPEILSYYYEDTSNKYSNSELNNSNNNYDGYVILNTR